MRCMPSVKEEADPRHRKEHEGSDGKIIYQDEAAAKAAALGPREHQAA
jgi:hypothetical protein